MIYNFDELEFKPISVNKFIHKDGFFTVKGRPFASFGLRVGGEGRFEINGERFTARTGDLIFIPANMPYKVEYLGSESIVAHLDGCNYRTPEYISLKNAAWASSRFENLLGAWNEKHSVHGAKSILYGILEGIAEEERHVIKDAGFSECVAYIHAHCLEPTLDIEGIAARAFISASTLQRKFHKYFAMTPKQYLTHLRMNKALEFLAADRLSVGEVAAACGFTDEKYFSRAFKLRYGCPPSEMKKHILT